MASIEYDLCDCPPLAESPFVDGVYGRRADMYAAVEEYAFGPVPTGDDIRFEAKKVLVNSSCETNELLGDVRGSLLRRGHGTLVDVETLALGAATPIEGLTLVDTLAREVEETEIFPSGIGHRVDLMLYDLDLRPSFLKHLGVSLCGGALFASLTNRDPLTPEDIERLGTDLDLFVTSSDFGRADRLEVMIEHARKSTSIVAMCHKANGFCDDFVFEYASGGRVKVQIVSSGLMVDAADVIRSFDLPVCKLALIDGRVMMTPDAEFCFRNKALLYVRGMSKDARYPGRLLKYLKRLPGYRLAVDEDAHAAIVFAARLLDSLRLKVGLSRCARCKRAVALALNAWTKEMPPCDLGVFASYMAQLEFPVEKAHAAPGDMPSAYAFGNRVLDEAFDIYVDVEPIGGTCGRSNVDPLCLQADPLVDLYALYLAVKIDRTMDGVLRSMRSCDLCMCADRTVRADRAEDCLVEGRRYPCVVHRVPEPKPPAPRTLFDTLSAVASIVTQYLYP
jgi:hypothetical protein